MTRRAILLVLALGQAGCGDAADGGGPDAGGVPDTGTGAGAEYLFDLDRLHHFEVELSGSDWTWLKDNARLEQYRPATLVFEGERHEGAAIRFKGGYGTLESCFEGDTQVCPKLSVKVSFNEYDDQGRFFGLRKLVLNSSVRDPTLMHEVVGYKLFRDMGVPAPRATHATLTVNGEELGLFVLVEEVDKELVQDHFSDDEGNLYKSVWPRYDEPGPYVAALQSNRRDPDVSDMLAFHDIVEATGDETFLADTAGWLDPEALARYLAVDRAIANTDGVTGIYCYAPDLTVCENLNYYWYHDGPRGMVLLPWDLDYALYGVNEDLGRAQNDPAPDGCEPVPACAVWGEPDCDPATEEVFLLPPQCDKLFGLIHRATWDPYRAELARLADGPLSRAVLVPWITAVRDKIEPAVIDDELGPGHAAYLEENAGLDAILEEQLAAVQALLAEP